MREIREQAGISQVELANISGVSRNTIGKIESNCEAIITTETMAKLAKALNVKIADIFLL